MAEVPAPGSAEAGSARKHTALEPGLSSCLKMSRDGETNIPHSSYFPKANLFPVKDLCLISNMTLSGFSFRPLVFIIPWTNKPVCNHTHRYPALTFLSYVL